MNEITTEVKHLLLMWIVVWNHLFRARKITQWVGALAAMPKDLSPIPGTTRWREPIPTNSPLTSTHVASSRRAHRDTHRHTQMHTTQTDRGKENGKRVRERNVTLIKNEIKNKVTYLSLYMCIKVKILTQNIKCPKAITHVFLRQVNSKPLCQNVT